MLSALALQYLPQGLLYSVYQIQLWQWIALCLFLPLCWAMGRLTESFGFRILHPVVSRSLATWDDEVVSTARKPSRAFISTLIMGWLLAQLDLAPDAELVFKRILQSLLIGAVAWLLISFLKVATDAAEQWLKKKVDDPERVRGLNTQMAVLRRIGSFIIGVVTLSLMLIQFEVVRHVGVSLLASAGVAGLFAGLAAQKSLSAIFAGLQLSLTQPLRLGDVVTVEGERGEVEEITLTYLVIRLPDLRRLVIPITKLLDGSFQNWTLKGKSISGSVEVFADYRLPIAETRDWITEWVKKHSLWDGHSVSLTVSQVTEAHLVLNVGMSAKSPDDLMSLRSAVRETLVIYLQTKAGGRYLPHQRAEAVNFG